MEIVAIIIALLFETDALFGFKIFKGPMNKVKEVTKRHKEFPEDANIMQELVDFTRYFLIHMIFSLLGLALYIIYTIIWCFSPDLIIRTCGIYLLSLSFLSATLGWRKITWFKRLDAATCIIALGTVGYKVLT